LARRRRRVHGAARFLLAVERRAGRARRPAQGAEAGGWFGVVDHSAPAGTGNRDALDRDKGPHRIDEAYVKKLFLEAGFTLEASNDVLRNPADDRTKPFYDDSFKGKSTDRFVLLFRKKAE